MSTGNLLPCVIKGLHSPISRPTFFLTVSLFLLHPVQGETGPAYAKRDLYGKYVSNILCRIKIYNEIGQNW